MHDSSKFQELLADHHVWPCEYLFKFIFKAKDELYFKSFFPDQKMELKYSKEGKYASASVWVLVESPQEVMAMYKKLAVIEGIISL